MTTASLPWLARHGTVTLWAELPRALAAGLFTFLSAVPLLVSLITNAPGWLVAATVLPVALALTGLSAFAAAVSRGEVPRLTLLRRFDPTLSLVLAGSTWISLTAGPAGYALAALALLVLPYSLAYGAVRGRRGLAAVRGGAILAAYRPSWTVTLLALAVLGGFAVAASAGVLAIVVLPLVLSIACAQVQALLEEIDARSGR